MVTTKEKHFYWFVGGVTVITIVLTVLSYIFFYKNEENQNCNKKNSWVFLTIQILILIIFILYPILTHLINIRKDTDNIYQCVLILYLYMITLLLVFIGCNAQYMRDCYTKDNGYCIIKTKDNNINQFIKKTRGSKYYPHISDSNDEECLLTEWGLSHFLSCMVIGFLVPRQWLLIFIVTLGWEFIEYFCKCHDILDLVWNSLGIVTGVGIRYLSKIP